MHDLHRVPDIGFLYTLHQLFRRCPTPMEEGSVWSGGGGEQSWKTSTVLVLAAAHFDLSHHLLTTSFYSFQALQNICARCK